jgi:hypothetical protein
MSKYGTTLGLLILFLLFFSVNALSQETTSDDNYPKDFKVYDFTLFGGASLLSPSQIVKIDNNWEILLACLSEKTKNELRSMGITFTESQLHLLQLMRFLDINNEKLKTKMPILGSTQTLALRKKVRDLVLKTAPVLMSGIEDFKTELKTIKREESTYPILFSYVLDGLPWKFFYEDDLLSRSSQEELIWYGLYWAAYPPRSYSSGTNSYDGRYASVHVTTGVYVSKELWEGFSFSNLKLIRDNFTEHGRLINKRLIKDLEPYEIVDSSGSLSVPIIREDTDDKLFVICESMAKKVVNLFLLNMNLEELAKEFGFNVESEALIVCYHEFMWELLEYLEEKDIVKKPSFFYRPDEATFKDLGSLLFIIKKSVME